MLSLDIQMQPKQALQLLVHPLTTLKTFPTPTPDPKKEAAKERALQRQRIQQRQLGPHGRERVCGDHPGRRGCGYADSRRARVAAPAHL